MAKVLITKRVVIGIKEGQSEATHGKPGEVHELSSGAAFNICSVEKGVDISKLDPKAVKELREKAIAEEKAREEAEEAVEASLRNVQTREPVVTNRDPGPQD